MAGLGPQSSYGQSLTSGEPQAVPTMRISSLTLRFSQALQGTMLKKCLYSERNENSFGILSDLFLSETLQLPMGGSDAQRARAHTPGYRDS